MPSAGKRPGREAKVYLRPMVNGALEAYREYVEEQLGEKPAVNAVLLGLVETFLVEQGYLLPSMIDTHRRKSTKEDNMSQPRQIDESEFGGAPGLIQPPPHELTAVEQARLERRLNPADPEDSVEAARAREGNRMA